MLEVVRGTILYGMMGSGKTTLGQGLADHLGQPFVDTDQLIEARFGISCAEIIAAPDRDFGEDQAEAIEAYIPAGPEVVATGGSVAMYPELVTRLAIFGVGIFLEVPPEVLEVRLSVERIAALNNPKRLSFADLCVARSSMYRAAADKTLKVVSGESVAETQAKLIELRESIE